MERPPRPRRTWAQDDDPKPERERPRPAPERGDAASLRPEQSEFDRQILERVRRYPGYVTYIDLVRRNKRESVLLIGAMILLWGVVGAVIGAAIGPWAHGMGEAHADFRGVYDVDTSDPGRMLETLERNETRRRDSMRKTPWRVLGLNLSDYGDWGRMLPPAAMGFGIALVVAGLGAGWSWFSGSRAILTMAGAHPLRKEQDPELFNVVEEMSLAAGIPMPGVFLIRDSALNAFATGRDPEHGAVAITSGLREKLTRDELQGVIAHEIAHIRNYDIRFAMLMATMVGIIVFACDAFLRVGFYSRMGRGSRSNSKGGSPAGAIILIVGLLLAILAPLFARLIQMGYSRRREYLADAGAVELTRNLSGIASALSKLATDTDPLVDRANRGTAHMYIVNPLKKMRASGNTLNSLFSSHPPIKERISRLLALTR